MALADSDEEIREIQSDNYIQIVEFATVESRSEYREENYLDDVMSQFEKKKHSDNKS